MAVERFEITRREPYAGGRRFGGTGSYEQMDGVAHFAVDPGHEANRGIVDLALAPRDEDRTVIDGRWRARLTDRRGARRSPPGGRPARGPARRA